MTEQLTLESVPIPEAATEPSWAAYQDLLRATDLELVGSDERDTPDEERLANARDLAEAGDTVVVRLLARVDGEPVGRCGYWMTEDEPGVACLDAWLLPSCRGRGLGSQLVAQAIAVAEADPAVTRLEWWQHFPTPDEGHRGPRLSPSNGVGWLPADLPGTKLLARHGFTLSQVETVSRYSFAEAPDPAPLRDAALATAGPDYVVHTWEGGVPDHLAADVAHLKGQMFTEAPAGDFDPVEVTWDVERLRRNESGYLPNWRKWVAAAEHLPSGRIVAFTELLTNRRVPSRSAEQGDTLVLPEHRGHRLGLAVKAANHAQVRREVPDAGPVYTWNASENSHMLAVNTAIGFAPVMVEGGFRRA